MSKQARPDLAYATCDDLKADVDHLRTCELEQAGRWDLPMILDHISRAVLSPFDPAGRPVPRPLRFAARLFVRFVGSRKKYPTIQMPAPKDLRPVPGVSLNEVLPKFEQAIEKLRTLPQPTCDTVIAGPLNSAAYLRLQLLHAAHHLAFLKPQM